jgi:hypothetical protein
MNKNFLCISVVIVIIFFHINFVSPIDDKVVVDVCEFALSELDVGGGDWAFLGGGVSEGSVFKVWDESTQTGVYMTITNTQSLGQPANYVVSRHTPARSWFNEFENSITQSKIPIINVGVSTNKWQYFRCRYKVGNSRIFLSSSGFGQINYFTNDYNLTKNLFLQANTMKNQLASPDSFIFSYSGSEVGLDIGIHALNNGVVGEDGFFPNSNPYIIYKGENVNGMPSSLVAYDGWWLIREPGTGDLVSSPLRMQGSDVRGPVFYVNNSRGDVLPQNYFVVDDIDYKRCVLPCSVIESGKLNSNLKLIKDRTYQINNTFKNNYAVDLNISFLSFVGMDKRPSWRGIGYGDVPIFEEGEREIINVTIPGGGEYNLTTYFTYLNGISQPRVGVNALNYVYYTNKYNYNNLLGDIDANSGVRRLFIYLASEEYPYLSFIGSDPRISIRKNGNQYETVLNISVNLFAEDYANNNNIQAGQYDVGVKVANATNIVYLTSVLLNRVLSRGEVLLFNFIIPIDQAWNFNEKHRVYFFSRMNEDVVNPASYPNLNFKDRIVAHTIDETYFKPGDIAYQLDDKLVFSSGSRRDVESIIVFNPSFYPIDIDLTIDSWSHPTENFMASWDGVNFGKHPSLRVKLLPLQSREINFWVTANYNPWPISPLSRNLVINASSDLKSEGGVFKKTNQLNYELSVTNAALDWFNFKLDSFSPDNINILEGGDNNKVIRFSWWEEGSVLGFNNNKGKDYNVSFRLINATSGSIIIEENKTFEVGESHNKKFIDLSYDFIPYRYNVFIQVDPEVGIFETDSSGNNANDNSFLGSLMVNSCRVRAGYLEYYNSLDGEWKSDINCEWCSCGVGSLCMRSLGGRCVSLTGSCNFNNMGNCNDINIHPSELCAWRCNNNLCPPPDNYGGSNDGNCLNCSSIINSCSGYNNKETCEIDPCFKVEFDCEKLGCEKGKSYSCQWDNNHGCYMNSSIGGRHCKYVFEPGNCELSNIAKGLYRDISGTLGCENKEIDMLCAGKLIRLDFFGLKNFFISIFLLFLVYFFIIYFKRA